MKISDKAVPTQPPNYRKPTTPAGVEGDEAINLNERQAAKFLGIGARTLWQLRRDGSVPYVRFGRTVRYPKPLLVKWLLERAQVECAAAADGRVDNAVATVPNLPNGRFGIIVPAEA
jgi:excisionase family DNA binding protein